MNYMHADFIRILAQYGHDIMLQRKIPTADGSPAYSSKLEIHTVRHMANTRSLPNAQQEMVEGILNTSERIYFFKHDSFPYEGDRIYEEDPRNLNRQSVFVIDQALPMRGPNGEIVFYTVGATRVRPN